ncbi:MAG: efflux RND transporter permease subunit [Oscillospiraceae bacterium]
MIKKIAEWISSHPKLVLIVCVILIIPSIIGYLGTFVNYDILSYLPKDLNSVQGEQVLENTFHCAASSILIIDDEQPKNVQKVKEKIEKVEGVSSVLWVDDILDISFPQSMLPDVAKEIFYSQDGTSTLLMIQYDKSGASKETLSAIKDIRLIMNKNCFLSGVSAITADTKEIADSQAPIYIAIAIVLALIALTCTMQSWILPFVLLAALCTAVIYNMGTNIMFGSISFITQCIAAILQLGVTMDYSVFLIDRYEEELLIHNDRQKAMSKAIQGTFVSLCGSSLTTIFGFLALCFMSFTLGLDIGLVMAKGVVFGVVTVVTLLPAMILLLGDHIEDGRHKSLIPNFEKLNAFTLKHKRIIVTIFLLLFIPSFLASQKVDMYYNMDRALPSDLPSISALYKMKDDFNMATTHFIIIDEKLPSTDKSNLTSEIKKLDGITNVISMGSFLGPAVPNEIVPEAISQIASKDGKEMMMVNASFSPATPEENKQVDEIENIVKKYDSSAYITGEGALTRDLTNVTNRDFKITSAISIIAIFILIAILFKSVSIPFILVSSIELAILINQAMSFLMGATIPFIAPTIIGCVQLGATVDYAILLTTRFKEELRKGKTKKEAILKAANESDRSIFQSALVFFSATFGVYLVCDIAMIKSICAMLARGSVISAFIIIFMLTPILLLCEGAINKTTLHWRKERKSKQRKEEKTL